MKRLTIRDESGYYHLRRGPKGGEINKITVVQHLGRLEDVAFQPTLTQPNEWVSVEDAVPDPGERVLATDGIFVGEAYRTSADSWHRHTGFPWRDGVTGRTVKYWMLLPAPPAKEDQK